jgi:glutathione S-transferase
MALTIYGSPRSRTMRILWTAAELGLDYEHVPLGFDDPQLKSEAFRRVNPAGAIPAIVDDGFALSESLAINLYLTKKYGSGGAEPLYPSTIEAEAEVWRWTLWAQGHLEPWVQRDALLADLIAAIGDKGRAIVERSLSLLETSLDERRWLIADHFTVADLNVAAVLSPTRAAKIDLARFPKVRDWLGRCYARPAAVAARARFQNFPAST